MRLLLVEDEPELNEIIAKRLKKEHYGVDQCFDGEEAWDYIEFTEYDAIILDIMLPKIDGIELMKRIRSQKKDTPVIMLTAKDSTEDRVKGLDSGADDYLIKPFAFDELLARIRVLLRRHTGQTSNTMTLADLVLDTDKKTVKRGEQAIILSSKEYAILEYMMHNQGIVLSRDKIEQHIWNYDYVGGSNIVDVYIRYLRVKIDKDAPRKLIHTVRGMGYVMREDHD
ncbi:response regulator transcription factor [Alkalibacterium olivapovliticus]|uniref:DNA-binding response OmpR family regulator n=1 Tax=Alkalibacterium olivapovliticus TaxID=99907 RepID=A0A2T0VTR1_9LACT|nr:response regulator transcription factor [Alkalibacterium olivapovliticus]PRY74542.1 DNA-binding response OmpR family regulator [Alkalibacterium olivapovliticus]